jgi:hypothetical protein
VVQIGENARDRAKKSIGKAVYATVAPFSFKSPDLRIVTNESRPTVLEAVLVAARLRRGLIALREGAFDEAAAIRVTGQSFVPAEEVMTPSGPNILLVLGLTVVVALAAGIWLALQSR